MPAIFYYEEGTYDSSENYSFVNADSRELIDNSPSWGELTSQAMSNIKIGMRYYPVLPEWVISSENDWHNSVMMALSPGYQPGGGGACTVNCLTVSDFGGENNIASLLIMAGSSAIANDDLCSGLTLPVSTAPDFSDELCDIFEPGNDAADLVFLGKSGDDTISILQEQ